MLFFVLIELMSLVNATVYLCKKVKSLSLEYCRQPGNYINDDPRSYEFDYKNRVHIIHGTLAVEADDRPRASRIFCYYECEEYFNPRGLRKSGF